MIDRQNAHIADSLHLRDAAMATIFWLAIYGVHIGATCRLSNASKLSVCGGDAVLCQITLTTCYYSNVIECTRPDR